jgi:demethoxyubiquinone hydroxylase (CLK1/Coq7/Cat5 family)
MARRVYEAAFGPFDPVPGLSGRSPPTGGMARSRIDDQRGAAGPTTTSDDHVRALVGILQAAHAGELAAAYAYQGHWRSRWRRSDADARSEILRIEGAEWHHRRLVHVLLDELGAGLDRRREVAMAMIGWTFGWLCFVSGRFFPMYFAGRLEAMNVGQYVDAAKHARAAGLDDAAAQLDDMVAEEARHEAWFSDQVRGHWALGITAPVMRWKPVDPA